MWVRILLDLPKLKGEKIMINYNFKIKKEHLRPIGDAIYNPAIYKCPECGETTLYSDKNNTFDAVVGFNYAQKGYSGIGSIVNKCPVIIIECQHCFEKYYHHIDERTYDLICEGFELISKKSLTKNQKKLY
jgi:hypothetical protein